MQKHVFALFLCLWCVILFLAFFFNCLLHCTSRLLLFFFFFNDGQLFPLLLFCGTLMAHFYLHFTLGERDRLRKAPLVFTPFFFFRCLAPACTCQQVLGTSVKARRRIHTHAHKLDATIEKCAPASPLTSQVKRGSFYFFCGSCFTAIIIVGIIVTLCGLCVCVCVRDWLRYLCFFFFLSLLHNAESTLRWMSFCCYYCKTVLPPQQSSL